MSKRTPYYAHHRTYAGQPVGNDPTLLAHERETGLNFSDASGLVSLNTHNAALIRHLVQCPFVMLDEIEEFLSTGQVVGLSCSFPIGALSIHMPRQNDYPSRVVSRAALTPRSGRICVPVAQGGGREWRR